MTNKIVIVGSGAAGLSAASGARAADPEAEITVYTQDVDVAYSPCMIPWVLGGKSTWENMIMHTPDWYMKERNIRIITGTTVEGAVYECTKDNAVTRNITVGGKTTSYDKLILATGGKVFIPPIEGIGLPSVFTVRTVEGGRKMQEYLSRSKKVVIAGAGVIGLELALQLKETGKNVTVIEMMDQVIPRIADKDMADSVQKYIEDKGVRIILKAPVQAVNGKDRVESVSSLGDEYPCDIVIFATGVRANIDLAKQMNLDIGQLGAVCTAPTLQAYQRGRIVPDVYVCGDVMQCQSAVYSGPIISQLGSSAVREGKIAGANAAGAFLSFGPVASPWVFVIGDLQVAGTGMSTALASWYGKRPVSAKVEGLGRARYYPGAKKLIVKVMADADTHRIIGAQILGGEDVTGRIDWLNQAIVDGVTVEEFAANVENAYCPLTSMVRDVVLDAVGNIRFFKQ